MNNEKESDRYEILNDQDFMQFQCHFVNFIPKNVSFIHSFIHHWYSTAIFLVHIRYTCEAAKKKQRPDAYNKYLSQQRDIQTNLYMKIFQISLFYE